MWLTFFLEILASSTPQEQAIIAKLNQAKQMGIAIFTDCLNRVANLEMFVSQVTNIRAGLPFARSIDGLSVVRKNQILILIVTNISRIWRHCNALLATKENQLSLGFLLDSQALSYKTLSTLY